LRLRRRRDRGGLEGTPTAFLGQREFWPLGGHLDKRQFDKLMTESPNVAQPKIAPRKAERPAPEKRTPTKKEDLIILPVCRIPAR
jgi:hypothetical protein